MKWFFVCLASLVALALTGPSAIAGTVLAAAVFENRIDKWDPSKNTLTPFANLSSPGPLGLGGMAYNPFTNRVLVAANFADLVFELDPITGDVMGTISVNSPAAVAVDSVGNIYVTNQAQNSITRFDRNFGSPEIIPLGGSDKRPNGIAIVSGEILISTLGNAGVLKYDPTPGSGGFSPFNSNPSANGFIAVDSSGTVFVGGLFSNEVTKFDSSGAAIGSVVIDDSLLPSTSSPPNTTDTTNPGGVAIDGNGNLIVGAFGRGIEQNPGGLFLFPPNGVGAPITSLVGTSAYSSVLYYSAVPEPTSLLALGVGLSGFVIARRIRRRSNSLT